jgi:hypothetical protein
MKPGAYPPCAEAEQAQGKSYEDRGLDPPATCESEDDQPTGSAAGLAYRVGLNSR